MSFIRAAVALALVGACGNDEVTTVDAMSTDASAADAMAADAANAADASIDATGASVTVTVYRGGLRASGVAVQYHAADGSYLGSVTTDSSGVATIAAFPSGGAVTVPLSPAGVAGGSGKNLTTMLDVEPGDQLTFGTATQGGSAVGGVALTLPSTPSSSWIVKAACAGLTQTSGNTITATPSSGCLPMNATAVDAVVYQGNSTLADARASFAVLTDLPISGSIPSLTASGTFGTTSTALARHTIALSNVPGNMNFQPGVYVFRNGVSFGLDVAVSFAGQSSGSATVGYADGFFGNTAPGFQLTYSDNSRATMYARNTNVATNAAPLTTSIDLSNSVPGPLGGVSVSGTPENVTWTSPTWHCAGDLAPDVLSVSVYGDRLPTFYGNTIEYSWQLIAPATRTSITVPTLDPATADTLWPRSSFISKRAKLSIVADSTFDWASLHTGARPFDAALDYPPAIGTRCTLSH